MAPPGTSKPSSASNTISSEPRPEPEVNNAQGKGNKEIDGVIDLCSEKDSNVTKASPQPFIDLGSDSDVGVREGSILKMLGVVKNVLNEPEMKAPKRESLKEFEPKQKINRGCNEVSGQKESGCRSSDIQLFLPQLSSTSATSRATTTETERELELKRKLDMVTAELSRSRTEQVKKRRRSTVREQIVFEVPDFPMEYYNEVQDFLASYGTPEDWYQRFNRYIRVMKMPEYCEWIQTRTTEFLPKVLKTMTAVWNKSTSATSQLNGSDLLNCRLVSKSWKRSVDKLFQEQSQNFSSNGNSVMVSTKVRSTDYEKLGNLVLTCSYSSLAKSSSALIPHPFPSRSFIISTYPLERAPYSMIVSDTIVNLLFLYGNDLHHFGYYSHQDDITHNFFDGAPSLGMNCWIMLRGWLRAMPNLRSLQISLPLSAETSKDTGVITQYPFPSLPKLVAFECQHVPSFFLESVLSYNKTIEKLDCFQPSEEKFPKRADTNNELSKISEFSMNVFKMSHVLPLGKVNWPLRKITLSRSRIYDELIDLELLFKSLESFQKTLQELNMKLLITYTKKNLRLKLPDLRKLDLNLKEDSSEEKISYDFLLPLNQLEMLKLVFEREESETDEVVQVIKLRGYLNRLYDSNAWELFPCLKRVEATAFYGDGCAKKFTYSRDKLPIKNI